MKNQRGSALIISLLILLVMTMLGISSMGTSIMEEKMAANDKNQKIAFTNAESTLSEAENDVLTIEIEGKDERQPRDWFGDLQTEFNTASQGHYNADNALDYSVRSNWNLNSENCIRSGNACYTVEDMGIQPALIAGDYSNPKSDKVQISRITVRGSDSSGISGVLLQSYLSKNLQQ